MKKTVNINLAGTFFHIDEDAYGKLQRYLDAIKKSLSDPQGSDEIIKDIEARIAELFAEKIEARSQVVSIKELDEVITVMGQPEDYAVDDEIFDDTPPRSQTKTKTSYKQLFRDIDNKFISGVSSGLGHYLGIDAIWVRLMWILLTLFSGGTIIIAYILFWVLVPAAESTSEKLKMTGEPINISNIEKKFKEGYDTVADKVKNADYDKFGQKVQSGTTRFIDSLGSILLTLLTIFVKFIGILVIIIALTTLVGLIIGLFTAGTFGFWGGALGDWYQVLNISSSPLWLLSLLTFFAVGIPFFMFFILGLKMLVSNLKSIGTPVKITLFILWLASVIGLGIIGLKQATANAFDGEMIIEEALPIKKGDTLKIEMVSNDLYEYNPQRGGGIEIKYNKDNEKILYNTDVRLIIRSTKDSISKLIIEKKAEGKDYLSAKKKAQAINYTYQFLNNTLFLDGYLTTDYTNKYRNQEVTVYVYLPEGSLLYADKNSQSYHKNTKDYKDILFVGQEEKHLIIGKEKTTCLDCPPLEGWEKEVEYQFSEEKDTLKIINQTKKPFKVDSTLN